MEATYIVIIEPHDLPCGGGRLYGAFVPDVPGCTATGKSLEEVLERTRTALGSAFRFLQSTGRDIPRAHSLEEHTEQYGCSDNSLLGTHSMVAMIDVHFPHQYIAHAA